MIAKSDIESRIKEFMNNEARSCSMDFGRITPLYIYRMLGGAMTLEEIEVELAHINAGR